ncbi:IS1096 element passenger TnpR family protein [Secundilactobacillus kimchicus]|nr:hypothetical protein [Secundilactobacillus kimchicus]
MDKGSLMQLKISLLGKRVSRTVLVANSIRYDQLHGLIQLLFGWSNLHLHRFDVPQTDTQYRAELDDDFDDHETFNDERHYFAYPDLQKGDVIYTYDFEANLQHRIRLEENVTMAHFIKAGYPQVPFCVSGVGVNRLADSATEPMADRFDRQAINDQLAAISDGWFSLD